MQVGAAGHGRDSFLEHLAGGLGGKLGWALVSDVSGVPDDKNLHKKSSHDTK